MSQWYRKVPTVGNAKENCRPGGIIPEFHPMASDVEVWEVESVFVQVTVVPTATFSSPGLKALFPNDSAPTGIATAADIVPGAGGGGVGDGVGDGEVGVGE